MYRLLCMCAVIAIVDFVFVYCKVLCCVLMFDGCVMCFDYGLLLRCALFAVLVFCICCWLIVHCWMLCGDSQ